MKIKMILVQILILLGLFSFFYLSIDTTFAMTVQPLILQHDQKIYDLSNYYEAYIDSNRQLTIKDVTSPQFSDKFVPYNFNKLFSTHGVTTWLRFQLRNNFSEDMYFLLADDLYAYDEGAQVYMQNIQGEFVPITPTAKPLHIKVFPVMIPSNTTKIFYISRYSESRALNAFFLTDPYYYVLSATERYFLLGIIYGIPLALLIQTLFIFLFLRDNNYLIYTGFVLVFLITSIMDNSLLNRFPMIVVTNWWFFRIYRLSLVFIGFFYVLFAKNILQAKLYAPRMNALMNIYLKLVIPFSIITFLPLKDWYAIKIHANAIYIFSGMLLALVVNIIALYYRYKPAQYYFAGMVCLLFGEVMYYLGDIRIIPYSIFTLEAASFGLVTDMILQAIALAMRFKLIKQAEIEAKVDLIHQEDINTTLQEKVQQEQQQLIKAYARFFPQQFLDLLHKKSIVEINLGDQIQKSVAVLFTDFRNFTSIIEKKTPQGSFEFLNDYFNQIGPLIRTYDGFINKYIGDATLSLFEKSVDDAFHAAIGILYFLIKRKLLIPIQMGISIHYGSVMIGTIGEQRRMDGAVMGEIVNVVVQLESLNKIYGTRIIASEQAVSLLKNREQFKIRLLDQVLMKNKQINSIYEVFDVDPPERIEKKIAINKTYEIALQHYRAYRFEKALDYFDQCNVVLPDDKVIHLYQDRCKRLSKTVYDDSDRLITTFVQEIELA